MAQPNFLIFITDQHRADHVGYAGNTIVRTPNIDSIAARGVAFSRFTVASPVCQPNRATLMTGRLPSLHGVRHNGIPLDFRATTFVEVMRRAGWRTALIGKSHLQNMVAAPPGYQRQWGEAAPPPDLREAIPVAAGDYDQELPTRFEDPAFRVKTPFYGFDHVELCDGHGDQTHGDWWNWLRKRGVDPRKVTGAENQLPGNTMKVPQAWRTSVPTELYPTTYIAEQTCAYLEDRAKEGKPFMVQCSFPDPHHPFTPPGKYWDMYDPKDMPLPAAWEIGNAKKPPHVQKLLTDRDAGKRFDSMQAAFAIDEREAREAIALSYGMITMIDDQVGRVLAKLKSLGLDKNTIVVFTADHGDLMGDHQLLLKGAFAYRGLVNVPFVWSDPERPRHATTDALGGTLDLAATMLDRCGIEPYNGIQGMSLLPVIEGRATKAHDGVFVEYGAQAPFMGAAAPMGMRSLITEGWRITFYRGLPWGELYDLTNDPWEKANLWDDPAHAKARGEMSERFARATLEHEERSPLPVGRA
jgi:arylsulfatase A-like enzyme